MTERWQQQLRKLREIEPPADGWHRAESRDPSGDGLPPPRQRVVAGIVAFGVFAAAGAFGWTAFRPSDSQSIGAESQSIQLEVVLRAEGSWREGHRSSATMTVDGKPVAVRSGGERYRVSDVSGQIMVDPVEFLDAEYMSLDSTASVSVRHDADHVEATVVVDSKDEAGMPVDLTDSSPFKGVPAGRWLLRIDARWQEGQVGWVGNGWRLDARYFFPIEFPIELTEPSPIPIVLAGTEWRLTAIDDEPIDEHADRLWGASIAFKDRLFAGWSGCNSFGGKFATEGSAFDAGSIGGTQVGPCSGEQAWFERLQAADSWTSDGVTLTMFGPTGSFTAVRVGVEPVDVLRVECLPGRTQVLDPEVVATADGVDAAFGPGGHAKHVVFLSTEGEIESMVGLDDRAKDATVPLGPGSWSVRCVGWGDDIAPTEITVLARDAGSEDDSDSSDLRSTYVFSDIEAGPSTAEPQDLAISFTVAWSGGAYPGVHRCGYRALAPDGSVVGELVHLAAWDPGRWYHDVPGDPDAAVGGEVWCEPDRLDDPEIADVEPISLDGDSTIEDLEREYDERLESWAAQFSVGSMSEVRLAGNMWAVDLAFGEAEDFTVSRQLADRRHYLCVRLPPGHAYRGGEFCD